MTSQPVRVFISYSWGEGEEYSLWVKRLAVRLREDGVDAMCDAWRDEGHPITDFMNSEVRKADKILVLCSPTFRTKVHLTEDRVGETGVGWEAGLLTGRIFAGIENSRAQLIPVLTKGEWKESAPDFLLREDWFDLRNPETFEADYSRLLRRITVGTEKPPPLGALPGNLDPLPVSPLRGHQATRPEAAHAEITFDGFSRALLKDVLASRSPIVIALEEEGDQLDEAELLRAERHLTIRLTADQIEQMEKLGDYQTDAPRSIPDIARDGERVWEIIGVDRVKRMFKNLERSTGSQPIAWTGRTALLVRLYKALLIARDGSIDGHEGFLSLGFGDHYFSPVGNGSSEWSIPKRAARRPTAKVLTLDGEATEGTQSELIQACGHEITLLSATTVTSKIRDLVEVMKSQRNSRTRVAIGFGQTDLSPEFLQETLSQVPCLSIAGRSIQSGDLIHRLAEAFPSLAAIQAVPTVLSAFRREWVRRAMEANDVERFLDGIFWSTWSWVGKPLFADDFGDVIAASYPHLTDLRSFEYEEWYFNRREGIPPRYQANTLARTDSAGENRFHLYVSGGGGTGKSCFLNFIYKQLMNRPNVLAIWYRVDAPSSEWENVQRRIKEETELAARHKLGAQSREVLPDDFTQLGVYLSQLANNLRSANTGVNEVVLIIDQLERTFESGDEPDPKRLEIVSNEVVDLLNGINEGKGVRVFIASRKQYLPDFLRSFDAAEKCRLHFNVLQSINDETERLGFIRKVEKWCQNQDLIHEDVTIDPPAAKLLAGQVNGHPLEMMLALIHVFSQGLTKPITTDMVNELRPWEKLFDFDLRLARKDKLDWYFLLAMAHARTEIVGFEEVWWRLHLVDPTLTRRIDVLEPPGVLEWLWLRGHLGRTILARPDGKDKARFLEFFHANLRDYLLRDVMSRTGETPAAWRALDRLSAAAHDWEQMLQLLDRDEVHALMERRQFTLEPTGRKNRPERDIFYLLFLRDSEEARPKLCKAAKECFVLSAIVHDELARSAFREVFPDIEDQTDCCKRWLMRSPSRDNRIQILQYLVDHEMPEARRVVAELILADADSSHAERWLEIAQILAAPLYAARYRSEVVVTLLENISERHGDRPLSLGELPSRFRDFVIAACGANRDELLNLLSNCADRISGLENARLRSLEVELKSGQVVDTWLGELAGSASIASAVSLWESEEKIRSVIQLTRGSALLEDVTPDTVARWRNELVEKLGTPIPPISLSDGDGDEHELELRLRGRRVAVETFFPPRCQVLLRHWERTQTFTPPDVKSNDNEVLQELVLWLDPDNLRQANWELPMWTADEAMLFWLEVLLRRHFDQVFDYDLLNEFAWEIDVRGIPLPRLRQVVINLVHEYVPVAGRWPELIDELQHASSDASPDVLTQNLREKLGPAICQQLADEYGQLAVIILDDNLEKNLMSQLWPPRTYQQLRLDPARAHALTSSIWRHVERNLKENDVMPVVACERVLRLPLLRLIEPVNPRAQVLSYTELSPELRLVDAGMVFEKPEAVTDT
jgi:hypothetical protein